MAHSPVITIEQKAYHNRFKDAPWYAQTPPIILVGGAGGIGSWTSLLLTRAGFKIMIFDDDIIEEHNLGGQIFDRSSIGMSKVKALQKIIRDFSSDEIYIVEQKLDKDSVSNNFCVAAFDNMEARKIMFDKWEEQFGGIPEALFIDARLEAEQMWIYCVGGGVLNAKSREDYRTKLVDDDQIQEAPCTMKQTSHAAAMIASHIVGFFTNHYTNVVEKDNTRTVPFMWEYFIPMEMLNTEKTLNYGKQ